MLNGRQSSASGPIIWTRKKNESSYSCNSKGYLKHSSAQYAWARELIGKLRLRGGESILDIGCGDGKVTVMSGAHVPRGDVTGIDSSEDMIAFARKAYPPKDFCEYIVPADGCSQIVLLNRFDIAFSKATLHWVHDHIFVLKGVKEGLERSGRILFQMGGRGNAQDMIQNGEEGLAGFARPGCSIRTEFPTANEMSSSSM